MKNLENVNPTSGIAKDVYFKKFPFLESSGMGLKKKDIYFIDVEQIDLEVLDLVPYFSNMEMEVFPDKRLFVYLIGKYGNVIKEVNAHRWVHTTKFRILYPWTWRKKEISGTSVRQSLIDIGDEIQQLKYIVAVSGDPSESNVQIFKLPKRFSLKELIDNEQRKLRKQLDEE